MNIAGAFIMRNSQIFYAYAYIRDIFLYEEQICTNTFYERRDLELCISYISSLTFCCSVTENTCNLKIRDEIQ